MKNKFIIFLVTTILYLSYQGDSPIFSQSIPSTISNLSQIQNLNPSTINSLKKNIKSSDIKKYKSETKEIEKQNKDSEKNYINKEKKENIRYYHCLDN